MKSKCIYVILAGVLFTAGCYTQFRTLRDYEEEPVVVTEIDSTTGDTIRTKIVERVDTVEVEDEEREVCYWTRDFFGDPVLHCYKTSYPRSWLTYNYSPWWYRTDPYWYDFRRCPRYYYYDPACGCCRYYRNRYSPYAPPSSGGSSDPGGSERRTIRKSRPRSSDYRDDRGSTDYTTTRSRRSKRSTKKSTTSSTKQQQSTTDKTDTQSTRQPPSQSHQPDSQKVIREEPEKRPFIRSR
jgi:hypothetical protein